MKFYKILEHTADIRMKVEADSLPELFIAALEGMMSIIKISNFYPPAGGLISEPKTTRIIEISSVDKTALLIDFLNEALYQSHANKEIYIEMKFLEFSETTLKAEIYGQKVGEFDEDIKAVTYHEADIVKNEKGNFETVIVFDI